jgi:transposase-like protein
VYSRRRPGPPSGSAAEAHPAGNVGSEKESNERQAMALKSDVAVLSAWLRELREKRRTLPAMQERIDRLADPDERASFQARLDQVLTKLDREIRRAKRELGWHVAPNESLRLHRLDREIQSVLFEMKCRPRRMPGGAPRPRSRRARVHSGSRGDPSRCSSGEPGNDPPGHVARESGRGSVPGGVR